MSVMPDVLLVDIATPGEDGLVLLRRLRGRDGRAPERAPPPPRARGIVSALNELNAGAHATFCDALSS